MIKHPVFILTAYPNSGGIETVTSAIANDLHEKYGMPIDIITFNYRKEYEHLIPTGVTIHATPNRGGYQQSVNQLFIKRTIKDSHGDVIIYQDSYAPSQDIVVKTAKSLHLPLIVFEHNTPDYGLKCRHYAPFFASNSLLILNGICRIANRILNTIRVLKSKKYLISRKRYLYNNCTKYILLSHRFFPLMRNVIGNQNFGKLSAISNPAPKKNTNTVCPKENIIFCAARLVEQKNIIEMLRIWKSIFKSYPDWKFLIAGAGPLENHLKMEAQSMELQNIEFLGYVNPSDYYQRAKIFWMTSLFEGFGMTLVEAQTYGCVPVVYDSFESVKDIINNGKNGGIVKFGDRNSFINETINLISDDNKWEIMSRAAMQNYQRFELGKISKQWIDLFSSI